MLRINFGHRMYLLKKAREAFRKSKLSEWMKSPPRTSPIGIDKESKLRKSLSPTIDNPIPVEQETNKYNNPIIEKALNRIREQAKGL